MTLTGKFKPKYTRVAQLKTEVDFANHLTEHKISLPFDADLQIGEYNVFKKTIQLKSGKTIGNSLSILPMEGWDGTADGKPSHFTKRRWVNFAESGAKLLWGCEAVAVEHAGRANPKQLVINEANFQDFVDLFQLLQNKHEAKFGETKDFVIGLQLTHSGRFCKPNDNTKFEPKILYNHSHLDKKFGLANNYPIMTDDEIDELIEKFVAAAVLAQKAGFHFVDIKHCHGYLGHEFLSAVDRDGKYGGSFENRTRFLRNIVAGIKENAPGLEMGIRLSAIDFVPFKKGENGEGQPDIIENQSYNYGFGSEKNGVEINLDEPKAFLALAQSLGIQLICLTIASPYYNPHLTRPALFPPSDGYQPPEDPLVGVARILDVAAQLKKEFPELVIVGSGYSYLQEWLPNVAQSVLQNGGADSIGFGRMVLSYPTMPEDMLNDQPTQRKLLCRTFSDCTTAPRNGIVSGCYPLDPFYKQMPEAEKLKAIKETL
jgi:NADPH2 dehydrogenase